MLHSQASPIKWDIKNIIGEKDKFMVETTQPEEDKILKFNKNLRNEGYQGNFTFGRQIASIPLIIWNKWHKDHEEIRSGNGHPDFEKTLMGLIKKHKEVLNTDENFGQYDKKYITVK